MRPSVTNRTCSLWLKLRSFMRFCVSAVFVGVAVTIGILVVYFTASKETSHLCVSAFAAMIEYRQGSFSGTISVALGDFNNDSRLDIVVANSLSNNIGIFSGDDNGTFANQVPHSTGPSSMPYSVVVADFNNDDRLDIAVANRDTHNIGIFFGYGNGNFTSQTTFSTDSSRPMSIVVGDFNNDKQSDIAMVNYRTDNIGILFGYGNGSFGSITTYSTGYDSNSQSIAIGDLNNDTQLDIVVANTGTDNIGVILGYGHGTFTTQTTYSSESSSHPQAVAIADLNNDNRLDIVVILIYLNSVGVLLGYGDGSFAKQQLYHIDVDSIPETIAVGDMNSDFRQDIIVANYVDGSVSIFYSNGEGSLINQTAYSTGYSSRPQSIAIADVNNDKQLDIIVANSGTNDVGVLLNYGIDSFADQASYSTGINTRPQSVKIGDFNNDNRLDIAFPSPIDNSVNILLGCGNATFENKMTYYTGYLSGPVWIVVCDLNNDTRLDIIVANILSSNIGILLGYGNGTFENQITYSTGTESSAESVTVGDFNSDNRLDIAVVNTGNNNIGILLGHGNGTFGNLTTYSTGTNSGPNEAHVGDFNNDNRLDIVVVNTDSHNVGILLGFGDGTFENQTTYFIDYNSAPNSVAVGDFDDDARMDLVVADSYLNTIYVLFGYGNGSFGNRKMYFIGDGSVPQSVAVGDFNNDGQWDIVVVAYGTNAVGILLGYGNGNFTTQTSYSTGYNSQPQSVVVGDMNNDNRTDIIVANDEGASIGVFLKIC